MECVSHLYSTGGSWGGAVYSSDGCPGDCTGMPRFQLHWQSHLYRTLTSFFLDFVNNNPANFTNAYWDVAALRVYTEL